MSAASTYKLNEADAQCRLAEMDAGPVSQDDVSLTRYLIEQAVADGNTSLAAKLIDALSKISKSADAAAEKRGQLMDRNELHAMTQRIVTSVIENFEGCDAFEDRIDGVISDIQTMFQGEQE